MKVRVWLFLGLILWGCAPTQDPSAKFQATGPETIMATPQAVQDASHPRRLKLRVSLDRPQDLQVAQGDWVGKGQVICDRKSRRQGLIQQRRQIQVQLKQLERQAQPVVTTVDDTAERAKVENARVEVAEVKGAIATAQTHSPYTDHGLQVLPISTQPQQQALRQRLQSAQAELRLAEAELKEVQAKQTTTVKDVSLEQTLLLSQLTEVETKIQELGVVRAPYEGLIKSIKWLGQSDQTLTAEIVISLGAIPTAENPQPKAPTQKPSPTADPPTPHTPSPTLWEVVKVHDGDTMRVRSGGKELKVRLACIDAPELTQPLGKESRDYLQSLIKSVSNQVRLKIVDTDRYNRKVAEVYTPEGSLIQQAQTQDGMAYLYERYIDDCLSAAIVRAAQSKAQHQKLGIWGENHQKPWEHRQTKRKKHSG